MAIIRRLSGIKRVAKGMVGVAIASPLVGLARQPSMPSDVPAVGQSSYFRPFADVPSTWTASQAYFHVPSLTGAFVSTSTSSLMADHKLIDDGFDFDHGDFGS